MEVILLEKIEKLGAVGDVVNVKPGFARNFLLPQNKCLRATKENLAVFEAQKAVIEADNAKKRDAAEKEAKKLEGKFIVLLRQAGEDERLYGSVTTRDIAKAVAELKVTVERNKVNLDSSIKYLGVYPVRIALHPEVTANLHVNIARTDSEAKEAEKEFLNPTPKKDEEAEATEAADTEEVVLEAAQEQDNEKAAE